MKPVLALFFLVLIAVPAAAQLTESPQTIEPGNFLFEVDALRLSVDRDAGEEIRGLGVASTIVSAGLTPTIDLQLEVDLYLRETIDVAGVRDSRSVVGDLAFRAKWKFWEQEGGGAAAVIPYVRVPSGTGGVGGEAVEGGFILPVETTLPGGLLAGAMLQWDVLRNAANDGYDSFWVVSGYVQRSLTKALGVYAEAAFDAASTGGSTWTGTVGVGAVLNVTARLSLDYELLRGLNRRATDWTNVLRVNWRW